MTGETRDDGTQDSTVIVCNLCSEVILTLEGAYYDYPPEKIEHDCRADLARKEVSNTSIALAFGDVLENS